MEITPTPEDTMTRKPYSYKQLRDDARAYYALCAHAAALSIPTSLDDPRSPRTVPALREAITKAEAR